MKLCKPDCPTLRNAGEEKFSAHSTMMPWEIILLFCTSRVLLIEMNTCKSSIRQARQQKTRWACKCSFRMFLLIWKYFAAIFCCVYSFLLALLRYTMLYLTKRRFLLSSEFASVNIYVNSETFRWMHLKVLSSRPLSNNFTFSIVSDLLIRFR